MLRRVSTFSLSFKRSLCFVTVPGSPCRSILRPTASVRRPCLSSVSLSRHRTIVSARRTNIACPRSNANEISIRFDASFDRDWSSVSRNRSPSSRGDEEKSDGTLVDEKGNETNRQQTRTDRRARSEREARSEIRSPIAARSTKGNQRSHR